MYLGSFRMISGSFRGFFCAYLGSFNAVLLCFEVVLGNPSMFCPLGSKSWHSQPQPCPGAAPLRLNFGMNAVPRMIYPTLAVFLVFSCLICCECGAAWLCRGIARGCFPPADHSVFA